MRIYLDGQSAREAYLKELLQQQGHVVSSTGPWDLVVLSLPRSALHPALEEQLPSGQKILCGQTSPAFDALAEKNGWRLLRILEDEIFTQENAILSAEGAIHYAMRQSDFALHGARCAVIGYGRIGQALTTRLRSLGAHVQVAARRQESRTAAGKDSVSIDQIPCLLPALDLLFNTVPAPVIDREMLRLVSPHTLLVELASPPYGIDLAAAQEMGLHAWLESGIPGRYCPLDAARAMLRYMERSMKHE